MKLTLVAAIRHLEQNGLPEDEIIGIDLWGDEGYELQALARQYEGATNLKDHHDFLSSDENPCKDSRLKCLMAEIGKGDFAIQFIDSYPATHRADSEINLRVFIMHRKTLQDALSRFEPCGTPRGAGKAPLQRRATASRPIQRRPQAHVLKQIVAA